MTGGPPQALGARPPTSSELALIDAFLSRDFHGVEALRVQARRVSVSPGCTCGCGTLDVHVPDTAPRSSASGPVPVVGTVIGAEGEEIGGLLLFVHDGLLSSLEVYGFGDEPLPLPRPEQVRWQTTE